MNFLFTKIIFPVCQDSRILKYFAEMADEYPSLPKLNGSTSYNISR